MGSLLKFDIPSHNDYAHCVNGCILKIKQSRLRKQAFPKRLIFDLYKLVTLLIHRVRLGENKLNAKSLGSCREILHSLSCHRD